VADPSWPEWDYPFRIGNRYAAAEARDVKLMLNYAAPWADLPTGRHHLHFGEYPDESIADWHRKRGLTVD
jgi:hypothetical protein